MHFTARYTPDEVITKIGTKGEYLGTESPDDSSVKNILYKNIVFRDFSWDYGSVSVVGTLLCEIKFQEEFSSHKAARDYLYSLKSKLGRRYLMKPKARRTDSEESFIFKDSEQSDWEGATAIISLTSDKPYSYYVSLYYYTLDINRFTSNTLF